MANETRGIALVILGIVAVIAVVGLVLLFVQGKNATGEGIYGGAIKGDPYPYWTKRGVPQNRPGVEYAPGQTTSKDLVTHWNYAGEPKRSPLVDIPTPQRKCGTNGFLIGYGDGQIDYYASQGFTVVETPDKAGLCAYAPGGTMLGGTAGVEEKAPPYPTT